MKKINPHVKSLLLVPFLILLLMSAHHLILVSLDRESPYPSFIFQALESSNLASFFQSEAPSKKTVIPKGSHQPARFQAASHKTILFIGSSPTECDLNFAYPEFNHDLEKMTVIKIAKSGFPFDRYVEYIQWAASAVRFDCIVFEAFPIILNDHSLIFREDDYGPEFKWNGVLTNRDILALKAKIYAREMNKEKILSVNDIPDRIINLEKKWVDSQVKIDWKTVTYWSPEMIEKNKGFTPISEILRRIRGQTDITQMNTKSLTTFEILKYVIPRVHDFCQEQGIAFFVHIPPVYKDIRLDEGRISPKLSLSANKSIKVVSTLCRQLGIPVFNHYSALTDISLFKDSAHLNWQGSKIYTRYILDDLHQAFDPGAPNDHAAIKY